MTNTDRFADQVILATTEAEFRTAVSKVVAYRKTDGNIRKEIHFSGCVFVADNLNSSLFPSKIDLCIFNPVFPNFLRVKADRNHAQEALKVLKANNLI